jgi:hypothetical protein
MCLPSRTGHPWNAEDRLGNATELETRLLSYRGSIERANYQLTLLLCISG